MTILSTGEIFSVISTTNFQSPSSGDGLELAISDVPRCTDGVTESWNRASIIRAAKKRRVTSMDQLREIYFPDYSTVRQNSSSDLPFNHKKGLLGEILTEHIVRDCGLQMNLLHVNWHRTGTSTGKGIDLLGVSQEGNSSVVLLESKFVGSSTSQNPTTHTKGIVKYAFLQVADYSELEHRLAPALHSIAKRNITSTVPGYDLPAIKKLLEARQVVTIVSVTLGVQGVICNDVIAHCPNCVQGIPSFGLTVLDISPHVTLTTFLGGSP